MDVESVLTKHLDKMLDEVSEVDSDAGWDLIVQAVHDQSVTLISKCVDHIQSTPLTHHESIPLYLRMAVLSAFTVAIASAGRDHGEWFCRCFNHELSEGVSKIFNNYSDVVVNLLFPDDESEVYEHMRFYLRSFPDVVSDELFASLANNMTSLLLWGDAISSNVRVKEPITVVSMFVDGFKDYLTFLQERPSERKKRCESHS